MGIDKISKFPFPSIPPMEAITSAERTLLSIGAFEEKDAAAKDAKGVLAITDVGRKMASLPLSPRIGRLLVFAIDTAGHSFNKILEEEGWSQASSGLALQKKAERLERKVATVRVQVLRYAIRLAAALTAEESVFMVEVDDSSGKALIFSCIRNRHCALWCVCSSCVAFFSEWLPVTL